MHIFLSEESNSPIGGFMNQNMGLVDRGIRIVLAIGLAAGALYCLESVSVIIAAVLAVFAAVFLITSLIGFCPLYCPLGISTKKK